MAALTFLSVGLGMDPLFVVLSLTRFMQFAVNGVVVGSVLALAAVGLTLVYGILRIANFAHGDFLTFGAYLALYFTALIILPATLVWAFAVALLLALFVLFERFVLPRIAARRGAAGKVRRLLSRRESLGLLLAAAVLVLLAVGTRFPVPVAGSWGFAVVAAVIALPLAWRAFRNGDSQGRGRLASWLAGGVGVAVAAHLLLPLQTGPGGLPLGGEIGLGLLVVAGGSLFLMRGVRGDRWVGVVLAVGGLVAALLFASRILLAVALALAIVAAFAVVFDLVVWRRARRQGAGLLTLIIISIGLALALRHAIQILWGSQPRAFPGMWLNPERILGTGVLITPTQALTVAVALLLVLLLHLFLRYTRTGKAMRALSDNMELARITGIDVDRVVLYVWIIAASMAATGGILFATLGAFTTNLGWFQILPIFAAVILGGIGSPYGALVGGFTIGLAMETSVFFGVPSEYKLAVAFGILILVLIVRPAGIFGGRAAR